VCDFRDERIVGVGIGEHAANGKKDFGDCEGGRPLITEDVETNATVGVDVWVINSSGKVHFWRFERVVCRKMNGEEENATRVWTITRSHDGCLPMKQIISYGSSAAARWRIPSEIGKFFIDSFESHVMYVLDGIDEREESLKGV